MRELFDFYGLAVEVAAADASLVEEARRDFAYFQRSGVQAQPAARIELRCMPPPYDELPAMPAAFFTPRNVCFRQGNYTYIDYFGAALAVYDRSARTCVVYGTDHDLLHEITYLYLLSTVGEYLDRRGVHRVHALGISIEGRGILILLPSGGGKSTLALQLLREPDVSLLGEDTPLIDRAGMILPFPLRMGVRAGEETGIPPAFLRTVSRMEFDPKTLIDLAYFGDRVGTSVPPSLVLVGERNTGDVCRIERLGAREVMNALVKNMVVGLGVYQGLEFLLERGPWEVAGKAGLAASRFRNALQLTRRAPAYRFVMGRDRARNAATLLEFIRSH